MCSLRENFSLSWSSVQFISFFIYIFTDVSQWKSFNTEPNKEKWEEISNSKFKMTLKFRYHWSLKSFSCVVSTLFSLTLIGPQKTSNRFDHICLPIHTCPELHSCISLQRLPQHRDFSSIFYSGSVLLLHLHHEKIFLELLRVLTPGEWLVIKLTSDPWYMILKWPCKISKKSSLIRTTLIKLNWVPERCMFLFKTFI